MTNHAFRPWLLPVSLLSLMLAGCAGNTNSCGDSHPYQTDRELPPLAAPAGVSLPAPDQAYTIPPVQGQAQAGGCMLKPPNVLGPLGTPAAISSYAPTITRHRHGKTVNEAKPVKAPGSATQAVPTAGTLNPPAAATHAPAPVASGGPME